MHMLKGISFLKISLSDYFMRGKKINPRPLNGAGSAEQSSRAGSWVGEEPASALVSQQ